MTVPRTREVPLNRTPVLQKNKVAQAIQQVRSSTSVKRKRRKLRENNGFLL
jgi:sensor histidine kinase regulating citrate/malate metabolism